MCICIYIVYTPSISIVYENRLMYMTKASWIIHINYKYPHALGMNTSSVGINALTQYHVTDRLYKVNPFGAWLCHYMEEALHREILSHICRHHRKNPPCFV